MTVYFDTENCGLWPSNEITPEQYKATYADFKKRFPAVNNFCKQWQGREGFDHLQFARRVFGDSKITMVHDEIMVDLDESSLLKNLKRKKEIQATTLAELQETMYQTKYAQRNNKTASTMVGSAGTCPKPDGVKTVKASDLSYNHNAECDFAMIAGIKQHGCVNHIDTWGNELINPRDSNIVAACSITGRPVLVRDIKAMFDDAIVVLEYAGFKLVDAADRNWYRFEKPHAGAAFAISGDFRINDVGHSIILWLTGHSTDVPTLESIQKRRITVREKAGHPSYNAWLGANISKYDYETLFDPYKDWMKLPLIHRYEMAIKPMLSQGFVLVRTDHDYVLLDAPNCNYTFSTPQDLYSFHLGKQFMLISADNKHGIKKDDFPGACALATEPRAKPTVKIDIELSEKGTAMIAGLEALVVESEKLAKTLAALQEAVRPVELRFKGAVDWMKVQLPAEYTVLLRKSGGLILESPKEKTIVTGAMAYKGDRYWILGDTQFDLLADTLLQLEQLRLAKLEAAKVTHPLVVSLDKTFTFGEYVAGATFLGKGHVGAIYEITDPNLQIVWHMGTFELIRGKKYFLIRESNNKYRFKLGTPEENDIEIRRRLLRMVKIGFREFNAAALEFGWKPIANRPCYVIYEINQEEVFFSTVSKYVCERGLKHAIVFQRANPPDGFFSDTKHIHTKNRIEKEILDLKSRFARARMAEIGKCFINAPMIEIDYSAIEIRVVEQIIKDLGITNSAPGKSAPKSASPNSAPVNEACDSKATCGGPCQNTCNIPCCKGGPLRGECLYCNERPVLVIYSGE